MMLTVKPGETVRAETFAIDKFGAIDGRGPTVTYKNVGKETAHIASLKINGQEFMLVPQQTS